MKTDKRGCLDNSVGLAWRALWHWPAKMNFQARVLGAIVATVSVLVVALGASILVVHSRFNAEADSEIAAAIAEYEVCQRTLLRGIGEQRQQSSLSALRLKAESLASLLAKLASVPLVNLDRKTLDDLCKDLSQDPDVLLSVLIDDRGEVQTELHKKEKAALHHLIGDDVGRTLDQKLAALRASGKAMEVRRDVVHDGRTVGQAVLFASLEEVARQQNLARERFEALEREQQTAFGELGNLFVRLDNDETTHVFLSGISAAALAILIGAAAAYVIAKTVTRPLRQAVGVLDRVAQGDLSHRLDVSSSGDLARFALALNHAIAKQASHLAELQSERKALGESEERFRCIADSAKDGIVMIDSRGRITVWSPAAVRIFGHRESDAIGKDLHTLIAPEKYHAMFRAAFESFRHTGKGPAVGRTLELEAVRASGETFPVEISLSSVKLHGEWHAVGMLRDITDRKQTERALTEAKESAEAANRAKSRFLANMSHEIRTPLNAVVGFVDLLRRGVDQGNEATRREYLQIVRTSGEHLLGLINDILDLSKIEADRLELEQIHASPHQLIADVVSILRVRAVEKGIALDCRWKSGVPETIHTDPARLRQLLMNLVSNAVKFTHSGSVSIVAELTQASDRHWLVIQVEDTGVGIPAERLPEIFDPFVQADSSVTREFGGTGLGLTICRRIAEAMGGSITVRSEVGRGSVFTLTLPTGPLEGIRILASPPADGVQTLNPIPETIVPNFAPMKVLLVEDGLINRKLITHLLQDAGIEVTSAENGQIGVTIAQRESFDLILMDMQMPVMDGYTATEQLRRMGIAVPIIALTAHAMKGDEDKCRAAGCSGYLAKPIDADQLLRTVAAAVAGAKSAAAAEPTPPPQTSAASPIVSTILAGRPDFAELVVAFIIDLKKKLQALDEANARGDVAALRKLAHTVKGTGGSVGFGIVSDAARQLETSLDTGSPEAIRENLAQLHDLANRLESPRTGQVPASVGNQDR